MAAVCSLHARCSLAPYTRASSEQPLHSRAAQASCTAKAGEQSSRCCAGRESRPRSYALYANLGARETVLDHCIVSLLLSSNKRGPRGCVARAEGTSRAASVACHAVVFSPAGTLSLSLSLSLKEAKGCKERCGEVGHVIRSSWVCARTGHRRRMISRSASCTWWSCVPYRQPRRAAWRTTKSKRGRTRNRKEKERCMHRLTGPSPRAPPHMPGQPNCVALLSICWCCAVSSTFW